MDTEDVDITHDVLALSVGQGYAVVTIGHVVKVEMTLLFMC
jgi:hypothetical protein